MTMIWHEMCTNVYFVKVNHFFQKCIWALETGNELDTALIY